MVRSVFDVLTDVLELLRIRTTLYALVRLSGEWGVSFPAGPGAYFHVVEGHEAWLAVEDGPERRLRAGDVVLLAHGSAHRLTHSRGGEVRVVFDPHTWLPNRASIADPGELDPDDGRGWGTLVCGAVELRELASNPLLAALPAIVHVTASSPSLGDLATTLELINHAHRDDGPGSEVLLARLGDVLVVNVLRAFVAEQDPAHGAWLRALRDPQIGAAIAAVHAAPDAARTVTSLAQRASLSRSRFAQRFTATVGEPPLSYVYRWRMTVAAHLLRTGNRSVNDIARAVGYQSDPAFVRAFSRHFGTSPRRYAQASPQPADEHHRPLGG